MLDNNTDIDDHKICYREILARVLKRAGIEKDQLELACGSGGKTSWYLRVKIPEGPEAIVCKTIDERDAVKLINDFFGKSLQLEMSISS